MEDVTSPVSSPVLYQAHVIEIEYFVTTGFANLFSSNNPNAAECDDGAMCKGIQLLT